MSNSSATSMPIRDYPINDRRGTKPISIWLRGARPYKHKSGLVN